MREKGAFSQSTYDARAKEVKKQGSATYQGEQRVQQGKGLDDLVDPKARGVIRLSQNLLVPKGDKFELKFGVAMPVKTDSDTTRSMGNNVDTFFAVQPKVQNLLIQGENAVLKRYHVQMATGSIGDKLNKFPYQCSQFEPDNEVERQMGLLAPERNGGWDTTEDYQLSKLSAARLTDATIWKYGLKGYYFPMGDERGRDALERETTERVFGPEVYAKAGLTKRDLPSSAELAEDALWKWHTFFLEIVANVATVGNARPWWSKMIGKERVVTLQRTADLAEIQAVIIGLTEGVLDLQNAVDFLRESGTAAQDAKRIVDACRGIPVGEQSKLPNFDKIPMAGAVFANREDIWPEGKVVGKVRGSSAKGTAGKRGGDKPWKL